MPFLLSLLGFVTIFLLDSCNTGRYKFNPESKHWLQFRGPNASGMAPENADPPIHFNVDTNLLWKTEMLPGWASPCIVNDRIFLTGYDDSDSLLYTFAINRESGDVVHKERIGAAGSYLSSPMLAGNRVYTCSYNGIVTVLSANDFTVLAHNKLRGKIGASPVAVDDVLYVRTDKYLYAFRDQK